MRADERGLGQSPGILDTMSRDTSDAFVHVVEWAAAQSWSSGKVGLLGVSYYAGSQWRIAARRPKGLAAIIPWEGMSDYYRDRCRHGGIFSNGFIKFWWSRQVVTNQYGRPGRAAAMWGEDTLEGDLTLEELEANRRDQNTDNAGESHVKIGNAALDKMRHELTLSLVNRYLDDEYYASKDYRLEDIEVPVLSVANWGGITLHLRGNVEGFTWAGSDKKWLRFITGRHDLPFYYQEQVELQRSFLDAFLRDDDWHGWKSGAEPKVCLTLRKGDKGVNDAQAERTWKLRYEDEWPIARTMYTKYYLAPDRTLFPTLPASSGTITYDALGSPADSSVIQFVTPPFQSETEITGHVTAHLNISMTPDEMSRQGKGKFNADVFVTLRHLGPDGMEIFYTGSSGDAVPLAKGWLRLSHRRVEEMHPKHRHYLPRREYLSTGVLPVEPDQVYPIDVEIWPTNVVLEPGASIVFELASGDTQGSGLFEHNDAKDRSTAVFGGRNHIHFDHDAVNYLVLPIIPAAQG